MIQKIYQLWAVFLFASVMMMNYTYAQNQQEISLPVFLDTMQQQCSGYNQGFSETTSKNFCLCQDKALRQLLTQDDLADLTSANFHNKFQMANVACHNHLAKEQVYKDCIQKAASLPKEERHSRCRCFAERSAKIVSTQIPKQYELRVNQNPNKNHVFSFQDLTSYLQQVVTGLKSVCVN